MSFAEGSQIPSLGSLCCCPLLYSFAHKYLMSLGQLISLCCCPLLWTLTNTWWALASWSASDVVLCCERSQIPDEPWPADQSLLVFSANAHKYLMSLGQLISLCCCPLLWTLTNTWWALASWSVSVGVLCCTLTNTWWALASWSASVGVLCCTLTIVASCFSRSWSTGPVQIRRKKFLHLSLKMRYELKMGSVMKKLCLIFYWNEEESLE
jgi:magnesium-transporting ATPase (P-type)